MASFWDYLGIVLASFWGRLGSFWDRFGIVVGTFWDRFVTFLSSGPTALGGGGSTPNAASGILALVKSQPLVDFGGRQEGAHLSETQPRCKKCQATFTVYHGVVSTHYGLRSTTGSQQNHNKITKSQQNNKITTKSQNHHRCGAVPCCMGERSP